MRIATDERVLAPGLSLLGLRALCVLLALCLSLALCMCTACSCVCAGVHGRVLVGKCVSRAITMCDAHHVGRFAAGARRSAGGRMSVLHCRLVMLSAVPEMFPCAAHVRHRCRPCAAQGLLCRTTHVRHRGAPVSQDTYTRGCEAGGKRTQEGARKKAHRLSFCASCACKAILNIAKGTALSRA